MKKKVFVVIVALVMSISFTVAVAAAPTTSPTHGWLPGDKPTSPASPTYGVPPQDYYSWIKLQGEGDYIYYLGPDYYIEGKDAEWYDTRFRSLMKGKEGYDILLGASANIYSKAVDRAGKKNAVKKPAKAINKKVASYLNKDTYKKAINKLFEKLDTAKSVKVEEREISDMIYRNPNALNAKCLKMNAQIPLTFYAESIEKTAKCLVYTFEDGAEYVFSINAGFSPVNWEKYVKQKPKKWDLSPAK